MLEEIVKAFRQIIREFGRNVNPDQKIVTNSFLWSLGMEPKNIIVIHGIKILELGGSSILLKFIALRVEVLGDGPFVIVASLSFFFSG